MTTDLQRELAACVEALDVRQIERRSIPVPESGCWIWESNMSSGKYGALSFGRGKAVRAHRYAYQCAHGPIPKGLHVLHKCDTPLCVNPNHLRLGTQRDNSRDMREKHRSLTGTKNPQAKLDDATALEIMRYPRGYRLTAERFGVSKSVVRDIRKGRAWTHVTAPAKERNDG